MHTVDPSASPSARLEVSTDTMEDYLAFVRAPLAPDTESRLAVVTRTGEGPAAEILTVDAAGRLLHLVHADPLHGTDADGGGWKSASHDVPDNRLDRTAPRGPIRRILAWTEGARTGAAVTFGGPDVESVELVTFDHREPARGWDAPRMDDGARRFLAAVTSVSTSALPDGTRVLYGRSVNRTAVGFLAVCRPGGVWAGRALDTPGGWDVAVLVFTAGGTPAVLAVGPGKAQTSPLVLGEDSAGRLSFSTPNWRAIALPELAAAPDVLGARLAALAGLEGAAIAQLPDGRAWRLDGLQGATPTSSLLTGEGAGRPERVRAFTVARQLGGSVERHLLLAVDARSHLWIGRLGADRALHWSEMGHRVGAAACGEALGATLTLFATARDPGGEWSLRELSHAPGERRWHEASVDLAGAAEEPTLCTVHVAELRVVDPSPPSAGPRALLLRAEPACELVIDGVRRRVGPDAGVRVVPGPSGRVVVRQRAESVGAPTVYAEVEGGQGRRFNLADTLAHRLAGRDPRSRISGERLRAEGLLPEHLPAEQAENFARLLRDTTGAVLDGPRGVGVASATVITYRLRFDTPFADGLGEFAIAREEHPADAAELAAAASVEPTVADPWGDFVQWLHTMAGRLRDWTLRIVDGIVKFVVDGVEHIFRTAAELVRGLDALVRGIASHFRLLVDVAGRFLAFLRASFDWGDIVRTADRLARAVDLGLGAAETFLASDLKGLAVSTLDRTFEALDRHLDTLLTSLGGVDLARPGGGIPEAGRGTLEVFDRHSCQLAYAARHLISAELVESTAPAAVETELLATLERLATEVRGGFERETTQLLEAWRSGSHTGSFVKDRLVDTIQLVRPMLRFVGDLTRTGVTLLLDVLARGIGLVRQLLETELSVPVLSAVYRQLTGSPLTVLHAGALAIAAPGTIVYKLLNDGRAPFPARTETLADTNSPNDYESVEFFLLPLRYLIAMTIDPSELGRVKGYVEAQAGSFDALRSWALGFDIVRLAGGAFAQMVFGATRDAQNAIAWGSGTVASRLGVVASIAAGLGAWPTMNRKIIADVTVRYLPDTPLGVRLRSIRKPELYDARIPVAAAGSTVLFGMACAIGQLVYTEPAGSAAVATVTSALTFRVHSAYAIWHAVYVLGQGADAITVLEELTPLVDAIPSMMSFAIPLAGVPSPIKPFAQVAAVAVVIADGTCPVVSNTIRIVARSMAYASGR